MRSLLMGQSGNRLHHCVAGLFLSVGHSGHCPAPTALFYCTQCIDRIAGERKRESIRAIRAADSWRERILVCGLARTAWLWRCANCRVGCIVHSYPLEYQNSNMLGDRVAWLDVGAVYIDDLSGTGRRMSHHAKH